MRKAGDLINEYLREGRLAANRSQPIGAGAYGVVYASDVPGNVIKQKHGYGPDDFVKEADLQSIAADMGIAPRVAGVETFRGGIGDRIERTSDQIWVCRPLPGYGRSLQHSDHNRLQQM